MITGSNDKLGRAFAEDFLLVFEVGGRRAALSLESVREVSRPLPCADVTGAPPAVLGVTRARGRSAPVVDLAALLGDVEGRTLRWLHLEVEGRPVALAVDDVIGLRRWDRDRSEPLPPLLSSQAHLEAVVALDGALVQLLAAGHLVPPEAWQALEGVPDAP